MVLDPGAHDLLGLEQRLRDLMQPRDVVLVMLDGIERDGVRQVGEVRVDASLGIDRHLVVLQVVIIHPLLQVAEEEVVGGPVLLAESLGRDGLDARQKAGVDLVPVGDGGQRVVAELVVVAVVADGRGPGGGELEVRLPRLLEERVLRGEAGLDGVDRLRLGGGGEGGKYESGGDCKGERRRTHSRSVAEEARMCGRRVLAAMRTPSGRSSRRFRGRIRRDQRSRNARSIHVWRRRSASSTAISSASRAGAGRSSSARRW